MKKFFYILWYFITCTLPPFIYEGDMGYYNLFYNDGGKWHVRYVHTYAIGYNSVAFEEVSRYQTVCIFKMLCRLLVTKGITIK